MIFDTHAHYDLSAFDGDRDELLGLMPGAGVGLILDPGCDLLSSRKAAEISEHFDFVYFAAGWHPSDIDKLTQEAMAELEALAAHPRCLAIGEIGLEYHWRSDNKPEQKALFARQLELALRLNKPVIVHDRDAHADTFDTLTQYPGLRGVIHCYSGSAQMAELYLERGWYLGFDGPITYKNSKKAAEVLEVCPLERILIETDSPYLPPAPSRGMRNDSRQLVHVIERIAEIKGLSPEEVEAASYENGKKLFGIGEK